MFIISNEEFNIEIYTSFISINLPEFNRGYYNRHIYQNKIIWEPWDGIENKLLPSIKVKINSLFNMRAFI